ncbi:hypothetical protein [Pedobacter gandavensis]|nr:hypothetical protein [Pedobacter gandavensis]
MKFKTLLIIVFCWVAGAKAQQLNKVVEPIIAEGKLLYRLHIDALG